MSNFTVFKQKISFLESSDRYYLTTLERQAAMSCAQKDFFEYYKNRGNIRGVLEGYMEAAARITKVRAVDILFKKLPDVGIYDVTKKNFEDHCWDLDEAEEAFDELVDAYNEIEEELALEKAYRAERKDSRSQWVGGGFGLGGAIKGAATAGALNMASGLGHSIVNAFGNASSERAAANAKERLYISEETADRLDTGIQFSVWDIYQKYMLLVNERCPDAVFFSNNEFDEEKAEALFLNAKNIPEKRKELLIQALRVCPYYADMLIYIFKNYPDERKAVSEMAAFYRVDISSCYEDVLAAQFSQSDQCSEEGIMAAKAAIVSNMRNFGLKESETLNDVDRRYMQLVYEKHYKKSLMGDRAQALDKIKTLDAPKELKKAFVKEHNIWELQNDLFVDFSLEAAHRIVLKEYQLLQDRKASKEQIEEAFRVMLPALNLTDKTGTSRETQRVNLFMEICEKELKAGSSAPSRMAEKEELLAPIFDYWKKQEHRFSTKEKEHIFYQKGEANKLARQQGIATLEPGEYIVLLYSDKPRDKEKYKTGLMVTDRRVACKGCGKFDAKLGTYATVKVGKGFFDPSLTIFADYKLESVELDGNVDKKLFGDLLQTTFNMLTERNASLQGLEADMAGDKKVHLAQVIQKNYLLIQCLQLDAWAKKKNSDSENAIKESKLRQLKKIMDPVVDNDPASVAKAWHALEKSGIDAELIAEEEKKLYQYLLDMANSADSYAREEEIEAARKTILACKEDEKMQSLKAAMDTRHEEVVRIEEDRQQKNETAKVKDLLKIAEATNPASVAKVWSALEDSGVDSGLITEAEDTLVEYLVAMANSADSYAREEEIEAACKSILAYKADERLQKVDTAKDARHEEVVRLEESRRQAAETETIMKRCKISDLQSVLTAWDSFAKSNCEECYYEGYLQKLDAAILKKVDKAETIVAVKEIRDQLAENNKERYEKYIQSAEKKMRSLDMAERTYRGVLFAAVEDIAAAKEEEMKLDIIMRTVAQDDMQSIENAIWEVSQNPSLIRNVYLETLNTYKQAQDQKMRLFHGVTYDSVEQAEEAKRIYVVVRDLMNAANLQDEESVLHTKAQITAMNHPITEESLKVLQESLDRIDVQKRTVDGILLATLDEATVARQEYDRIQNLLATINDDDEPTMLAIQTEITACTTAVKEKYLTMLQGKLEAYDVRIRTFHGVVYSTREDAATHRNEAATVEQLMRTLTPKDEPAMLTALEVLNKLTTNEKDGAVATVTEWLNTYDIEMRTVAGVLYNTREEAQLVASEYQRAGEIMRTVSPNDEASILNAQKAVLELTTFVKDRNYEILNQMWQAYDLQARTYLEFVFETRKQAQSAKEAHEEFLYQFNTLDLSQRNSLVTLNNFVEDRLPPELTQQALAMITGVRQVLDTVDRILQTDASITDMTAQKKESADLHKQIEKVLPEMTRYRMNTEYMQQLKAKHYASLNAAKKLFSFLKSKL